ncbi:MAG TPA: RteC domain-containing protein, partial [Puia sp.]|nr:RteC domain-containing protein [Puia sp.]
MLRDYSEIVRSELDRMLQDDRGRGDLWKYQECQRTLGQTIKSIRKDLLTDPFVDMAEEIAFFKEVAPGIWGQYHLYEKLVKIEARRKFQSKDVFISGLRQARQEAEAFIEKHGDICEYYYEGRTDADGRFFTRRGTHKSKHTTIDLRIDRDFTIGAYWLSRVRAHELLRDWLTRELEGPPEPGRTKK